MNWLKRFLPGALVCAFAAHSAAQSPLAADTPAHLGLSAERLKRVHALIERQVTNGDIAGAITVVARRGKVALFEAQGYSDLEAHTPMRTDSLMRIMSMTKPIATAGALMLLEDGHFQLEDPISKYLPEFKTMKVSVAGDPVIPAEREITIHDLMSHRSGLRGAAVNSQVASLAELSKTLASRPLLFQPGKGWNYGPSTDLLGHLVEVVSGQNLEQFLSERLWKPLGMNDTHFTLSPNLLPRLAPLYRKTDGKLQRVENVADVLAPNIFSGSAGLVSSAPDYLRFCQMLLNKGELDGKRYLSRKTIELMTETSWPAIPLPFLKGQAFGLGLALRDETPESGLLGSPGTYGWSGAYNTYFRIDPKEQLILILFVQSAPGNNMGLQYGFHNAVMQAIAD